MEELFGQAIWIVALVVFGGLLFIANYVVTKIGAAITGSEVEVSDLFLLVGAFIGLALLPSAENTTVASRLLPLAFSLSAGAFVGGLVGLAVEIRHFRAASSETAGSPTQPPIATLAGMVGKVLFGAIILICGLFVLWVKLGDMPLLSPLVRFVRRLF